MASNLIIPRTIKRNRGDVIKSVERIVTEIVRNAPPKDMIEELNEFLGYPDFRTNTYAVFNKGGLRFHVDWLNRDLIIEGIDQ